MTMTATMDQTVLDSIIKQAITLPETLRVVLAEQVEAKVYVNRELSSKLSECISEVRTIKQSTHNLRLRVERLPNKMSLSVKSEIGLEKSSKDCMDITRELKERFSLIPVINHFWLSRKIKKVNKLLDDCYEDSKAIYNSLQRYYRATELEKDTYLAYESGSLKEYINSHSISVSVNDWQVLEEELGKDPELTPVQLRAQERYLSSKCY